MLWVCSLSFRVKGPGKLRQLQQQRCVRCSLPAADGRSAPACAAAGLGSGARAASGRDTPGMLCRRTGTRHADTHTNIAPHHLTGLTVQSKPALSDTIRASRPAPGYQTAFAPSFSPESSGSKQCTGLGARCTFKRLCQKIDTKPAYKSYLMPDFQLVMTEGKGQHFCLSHLYTAPFVSFLFEYLCHFAQQHN